MSQLIRSSLHNETLCLICGRFRWTFAGIKSRDRCNLWLGPTEGTGGSNRGSGDNPCHSFA
jgi:hypothetical protein